MAQQTLNTPRETTHQRIADALEDIVDKIVDTSSASNIDYDNTQSGLDADKVQGAVDELASEKVDKVQGKGLSTNDYTDTEKQKLAGIEAEANKTVVDSAMSDSSTNPLQNRVVNAFLNEKTDISNFNALTQEIELFNTYDLSNDVEISVFANDTYKRDKYDRAYETHIPNLDGEYSVSLGDKTFTETCTFTIANQGTSITEVFHTNRKYILGAKLLKAENDEVGDMHVIADVVTLLISKDAPYTTTFDPHLEHPPATGVLNLKVSVKPDEKYVTGTDELAFWGSYNGSDLLINNPILTYSETTFGQPKVSGNPITINDAAEANAVDVSVDIEPMQDLHGYDHPWIGGAGKNKLPMTLDGMKASNTTGTWSGNTYTINGGTITVSTDNGGNVTAITVNGTFNAQTEFRLTNPSNLDNSFYGYILNGSPTYPNSDIALLVTYIEGEMWKGDQFSYNEADTTINQSFTTIVFSIYVKSGTSVTNKVFKPMLRLATETDPTFEPYSNISPITGQTEVVIDDAGVNQWDEEWELGAINNRTGGNYPSSNSIRSKNLIKVYPNTSYYIKISAGYINVYQYDKNRNYIGYTPSSMSIDNETFTTQENVYYIRLEISSAYGTTYNHDISINYPSTDTEYHAHKGKTYTIQLGDTIYGGELDVVTGELTVTHGYAEFDGSSDENWAKYSSGSASAYAMQTTLSNLIAVSDDDKKVKIIANELESVAYNGAWGEYDAFVCKNNTTETSGLVTGVRSITTVADWKTYLASNPLQVVYELAEPYTIQLTPQQIRLLKGTNNLSCNTGNLTIKYYPDNVLGQLKGDIESEYDDRFETLETQVQELQPSLIFMSRERRDITSDLSRLSTAVAEQNLAKYGYKIGDYFTGASGYTYILADYNTFKGTSTPYCITSNHLGIVVDTHQTSQWYSGDASSVGYNGSTLHTYLKGTVMDNIKADMIYFFGGTTGLEHLLSHSKLLTTALANWGWQANQYISALTCTQIDAGSQWTANGFQEGEASKSLELFRKYKWTEIFDSEYLWLRDLSNYDTGGSFACYAYYYGNLYGDGSGADSCFVVGLINFY